MSQAQMIQAITTPGINPELMQYYCDQLLATRAVQQTLLRNFNKDNPDTILPDVSKIIETALRSIQGAGAGNGNQQGGRPNPTSQVPTGAMGAGGVPAGAGLSQQDAAGGI